MMRDCILLGSVLCWGTALGAAGLAAQTRPADDRPRHNDAALADLGIHRYESRRLILYSDIDPDVARSLPPLVDAAYPEWVRYFGELPPAADGSDFQLTGYLMRDRGLFLDQGLLPEDLIEFEHGRHRGYRFWMAEQKYDYYRRHLLLHEATHCYMLIVPRLQRPPLFYLEGIPELFGAHELSPQGEVTFGVVPRDPHESVGFGRIEMIQRAFAQGAGKSLDGVLALSAEDFARSKSEPYAWSWALCCFLDTHPRYRERFRRLALIPDGQEFRRAWDRLFAPDAVPLRTEWNLFARTLVYGYDIERSAIDFRPGAPLPPGGRATLAVDSARGWQSSGVLLEAGKEYRLTAAGEVTLADVPKPWISQPSGVTVRYAGGYPIGRLLGWVDVSSTGRGGPVEEPPQWLDLGEQATLRPTAEGTLYLRVNDAWSSLGDNRGRYQATIEAAAGE